MSKPPGLLSEVRFGAFLVYSPRGTSDISRKSREWRDSIKFDRPPGISKTIGALRQAFDKTTLAEVLGPEVTLVPAPKSAPLVKGALWPAARICQELIRQGLGKEILPCVRRVTAVPKSAFAAPGLRPTPQQHLDSMAAGPVLSEPSRVTVIDDIVTKGATLLAVASHVRQCFPNARSASLRAGTNDGARPGS